MEFSKKLTVVSWSVALILTALAILLEGLCIVLPYCWGEVTAVQAFYLWKAKNENRAKYAQKFLKQIAKEWGEETAVRMAEIVLKD